MDPRPRTAFCGSVPHKLLTGVLGGEHAQTTDAEAQTASAQMARFRGSYR